MADVVVMPQLGNTVESCLVTAWRVAVGDQVRPDTVVADIETDKSAMEVPAGAAGTILKLLAGPGDEVPVKAPLLIIGQPGEDISGLVAQPVPPVEQPPAGQPVEQPVEQPPVQPVVPPVPANPPAAQHAGQYEVPTISPRALRAAQAAGVDIMTIHGSGPHGRILASDIEAALGGSVPVPVAPPVEPAPSAPAPVAVVPSTPVPAAEPRYTRAAAAEPPVAGAVGTGIGGRVTRDDLAAARTAGVPAAQTVPAVAPAVPPPAAPADFPGAFTETHLAGIRKLVAERMLASMAAHAQLTFDSSAPAASLLGLRAHLKASDPAIGMNQITIGDLVAYAAVRTALSHPSINATLDNQVLRVYQGVHLGLAVDTPRGLLVPTIRFASGMGLKEFSAQSKELAAQARSGKINPDLLSGATFTVTNLGGMGIESFTPILNSPQVAILGVNAIRPCPVIAPDGSFGVEQRISFSLTVDHGVVDGADAARYLQALVAYIANIDVAIMAESEIQGGING